MSADFRIGNEYVAMENLRGLRVIDGFVNRIISIRYKRRVLRRRGAINELVWQLVSLLVSSSFSWRKW